MTLNKDDLIFVFWGLHGNEGAVTRNLSHLLASLIHAYNKSSIVKIIGPLSPWSYRNQYRYDQKMCDPNRVLTHQTYIDQNYESIWICVHQYGTTRKRYIQF